MAVPTATGRARCAIPYDGFRAVVSVTQAGLERWIVAAPNRSASWSTNKLLIVIMATWSACAAFFFAALGLWPVIPFLGLELLALGGGLYYVCAKLRQRHVLRLDGESIVVQKGTYYPRFSWQFARDTTSLSVAVPAHPWDPLAIHLCSQSERIPLGDFLSKEDSREFLKLLRDQGLPIKNYSPLTSIQL